MNNKHQKTLKKLMHKPVLLNIKFDDVDKMLVALGYQREEKEGSRISFGIADEEIVLHKPHPKNEVKRYVVIKLQNFIISTRRYYL